MASYGMLEHILNKVKEAQEPERFTQDFLKTVLGFKTASALAFIPVAKRLGLLSSDGKPTDRHSRFRNPQQSKHAVAEGMRAAYPELYARNEYVHKLARADLKGLVMQITGLKSDNVTVKRICSTFEALKRFADFEAAKPAKKVAAPERGAVMDKPPILSDQDMKVNLSYTINLVLPKTDDGAVFNAIFQSLRENLLRK